MPNSPNYDYHNPQICSLGETAILVDFGHTIDPKIADLVRQLERKLRAEPFPGFLTAVVSYTGLCVYYDPSQWDKGHYTPRKAHQSVQQAIMSYLVELSRTLVLESEEQRQVVRIPVCYGGELGPDLEEVARHTGMDVEEVIQRHVSGRYLVYMMGFMPGFAYLGGMDSGLTTPRKQVPRQAVPAGAVGIAGAQTGIYPLESPGGWQIIGRTPITLFDATRDQPILLRSGMEVQFESITMDQFQTYQQQANITQRESYGD